jgi:hypothetical protein
MNPKVLHTGFKVYNPDPAQKIFLENLRGYPIIVSKYHSFVGRYFQKVV